MSDTSIADNMTPLSNLLIDEQPLLIFPRLATAIGLNESIILQQLHYWMKNPAAGEYHEGRKWVYNTYEQWQANFPFWSLRTIQGIMLKLEKEGLVDATDKFNRDPRDRTKWYTINLGRTVPCAGHANLASSTTQTLHTGHANLASSSIDKDYLSENTAETSVSRARKSSQIPPQFSPSEKLMQWCLDEHFDEEDVLAEVPQFVDYWLAKGESRKDWDASFRTWMRNSRKFAPRKGTTAKPGNKYLDPAELLARAAQLEEEEHERSRTAEDHRRTLDRVQHRTETGNILPLHLD